MSDLKALSRNRLLLLQAREAWDAATLIEWMGDPDEDVRDWATFTLAIADDDSAQIRDALVARVADTHFDTRCEAILGLARRGDARALPIVREALQGEVIGTLLVEAAGCLAHRSLAEPLERLTTWWDVDEDLLADAIAKCRDAAFE